MRLAESPKFLECGFDIEQMTDHVEQQNDVEGFRRLEVVDVHRVKFNARMTYPRQFDHRGAEVDAHAALRLQRRQLVSQSAADFQYLLSFRHEKSEIAK